MVHIVTPWELDLGDVQDQQLIDYYRAEGYLFPDEVGNDPVAGEGNPASISVVKSDVSLDLSDPQPPLDVAEPVVDEVTPTVDATAGALPDDA